MLNGKILTIDGKKVKGYKLILVYVLLIQIFIWDMVNYYVDNMALIISAAILLITITSIMSLKLIISRKIIYILLLIFVHGSINIWRENLEFILFTRQIIGMLACFFAAYLVLRDIDVTSLITTYINISVFISILGIIQRIIVFMGYEWPFTFGLDYGIRITSIMSEPANLGYVITPAFYICLEKYGNKTFPYNIKNWKFLMILIACLLAMSTLTYSLLLTGVILYFSKKKININKIILIAFGVLVFALIYFNVDGVMERINSFAYLSTGDSTLIKSAVISGEVHGSSAVLMINLNIALQSFKDTFGFGGGLGSHITTCIKYDMININAEDACSLFVRLLSETGWFGLAVFAWFIKKYHISYKAEGLSAGYLLNNFLLVVFAGRLMRNGNYFWGGLVTYLCMYYYNGLQFKKRIR